MSAHNDGGPAFPVHPASGVNFPTGMSLRDWFAGQALAGWLSGPCQGDVLDDYDGDDDLFALHQKEVAKACFGYADAMLAARERKGAA